MVTCKTPVTVFLAIQSNFGLNFELSTRLILHALICLVLDDTLEIHSEEDLPKDSPFLEAVKQMKEKKYDSIVDLCSQQIEKGLCGTSPTSASHCIIELFTACMALPLDPINKKVLFYFMIILLINLIVVLSIETAKI